MRRSDCSQRSHENEAIERASQPGSRPPSNRLSDACSFACVLPYLIEDWLKLGFSRDPMQRVLAMHRRWFEFFDLDRGCPQRLPYSQ